MKLNNKLLTFIIILSLFLAATLSISTTYRAEDNEGLADSPWPCFGGDARNTGRSPHDTSDNEGTLKWNITMYNSSVKINDRASTSTPSIGEDGTIYFGSNHKLYAVNPDGSKRWSVKIGEWTSQPAVAEDGTIYVCSWDSEFLRIVNEKLYAVNPNGTIKWSFNKTLGKIYSPAIGKDGTIYVGTLIGGNIQNFFAINPNGTKKWSVDIGGISSSPAIGKDGTIYIGTKDENIYALNPNGTEKWRFNTKGLIESSPAVEEDGTIYVGSGSASAGVNDKNFYALNPDGTEKWNINTDSWVWTSPTIGSDGTIYFVTEDGRLHALNKDGTERWHLNIDGDRNKPTIGGDGTIYVSGNGRLYAINPDGTEKWNYTSHYYFGVETSPVIDKDGTIYVGTIIGDLYAIGSSVWDKVVIVGGIAGIGVAATVYWYYRKEDQEGSG